MVLHEEPDEVPPPSSGDASGRVARRFYTIPGRSAASPFGGSGGTGLVISRAAGEVDRGGRGEPAGGGADRSSFGGRTYLARFTFAFGTAGGC